MTIHHVANIEGDVRDERPWGEFGYGAGEVTFYLVVVIVDCKMLNEMNVFEDVAEMALAKTERATVSRQVPEHVSRPVE